MSEPPGDPAGPHSSHAGSTPMDADDTRGRHFFALLGNVVFISLTATVAILALILGTSNGGAGVGSAAAAVVVALALLVAFLIANHRAAEDFFSSYADRRGLTREGKGDLPPVTQLLRKGDRRSAARMMRGSLPGEIDGTLAHYKYEVDTTDSEGNRETSTYPFTVVLGAIDHSAFHVNDILCQRRSGFRFMDSAEDKFRSASRLELESEAFDKRYEVFFKPAEAENWLKQLFIPSFIVWMAERAPDDLAFELSAGALCVNVKGHANSATELDDLCRAAAAIRDRIHSEATE